MKHVAALIAGLFVVGCAANDDKRPDPVEDFIKVNELEDVKEIRTYDRLDLFVMNDYYVIVSSRRDYYLLSYVARCRELPGGRVEPDVRRDGRVIRAGADTLRGCRIKSIYAIDEAQAEELRQIRLDARD